MSTKIYNGYRLPLMTLPELNRFCMGFREKVQVKKIEIIKDNFCQKSQGGIENYSKNWLDLQDEAWEVEKTQRRNPLVDFDFNVTFFPMDQMILAMAFTDQSRFTHLWKHQLNVHDYHYQDATDGPEGLSEEWWHKRRDDWNEALGDDMVPSHRGFTFQFSGYDLPHPSKIK